MPSHKVHAYVDRELFGKTYRKVHHSIDSAYPYLRGKHRIFWHDPATAYTIGTSAYPQDPNAGTAGLVHIELDKLCSANPFFHATLEILADIDARQRRRERRSKSRRKTKRKKPRPPDQLQEFIKFLKKIKEAQRLAALIRQ